MSGHIIQYTSAVTIPMDEAGAFSFTRLLQTETLGSNRAVPWTARRVKSVPHAMVLRYWMPQHIDVLGGNCRWLIPCGSSYYHPATISSWNEDGARRSAKIDGCDIDGGIGRSGRSICVCVIVDIRGCISSWGGGLLL